MAYFERHISKKMASQKSSLRARKAILKHHLSTPYSEKAFKGTYHYILSKSKSVEELGINIHFLCNGSLKVQAWWRKLFVRNNYSVVLGKAKFDCTIFHAGALWIILQLIHLSWGYQPLSSCQHCLGSLHPIQYQEHCNQSCNLLHWNGHIFWAFVTHTFIYVYGFHHHVDEVSYADDMVVISDFAK